MVLLCYKILNKAGRCRLSDVRRHFYGKEDFSPRVAPLRGKSCFQSSPVRRWGCLKAGHHKEQFMEIRKVPISLLNAAPYNPRKDLQPGDLEYQKIARSIEKYGCVEPIICIMITGVFPATDAVMDNAYQTLLGQNWIFVIGSLSAYLVSQSWDVAVFHAIRDRYIAKHGSTKGGRWLWNNGSTITSQIWDTVIYAVISFGFGLGWVHTHEGRMQLIGIIIGQYLLKACLALLDTPFFYFFTRNADRR